jgi:hypothetical protein
LVRREGLQSYHDCEGAYIYIYTYVYRSEDPCKGWVEEQKGGIEGRP